MDSKHIYQARAQWHLHDRGFVELEHGTPRTINFSAPPEFGGEPGLWTPEHFLLAAVASCFAATFRAVAEASRLEFQGIEVSVDGHTEKYEGCHRFTKITIRPTAIVFRSEERERAARLMEKTERLCLVTRSLSSQVTMEAKVLSEVPTPA